MNVKGIAITIAQIVAFPAYASADWCHPKNNTARILRSLGS